MSALELQEEHPRQRAAIAHAEILKGVLRVVRAIACVDFARVVMPNAPNDQS